MAIIYPLPLPAALQRIAIRPVNVVSFTQSPWTGQQQVQDHQGQYWTAALTIPPAPSRASAEKWINFLIKLKGSLGTFLLTNPMYATPQGFAATVAGDPVVDGGGQEGEVLNVQGLPISTTGYLLEGDFIQLGTGITSRLHKVIEPVDSDADGKAAISLWPRIRRGEAPVDSAAVVVADCAGAFRLVGPTEWAHEPGIYSQAVELNAVEAF